MNKILPRVVATIRNAGNMGRASNSLGTLMMLEGIIVEAVDWYKMTPDERDESMRQCKYEQWKFLYPELSNPYEIF